MNFLTVLCWHHDCCHLDLRNLAPNTLTKPAGNVLSRAIKKSINRYSYFQFSAHFSTYRYQVKKEIIDDIWIAKYANAKENNVAQPQYSHRGSPRHISMQIKQSSTSRLVDAIVDD